jgi:anaerobic sulfite reductase subunit B
VGEAPFTYVFPPDQNGLFDILIRKTGKLTEKLVEANYQYLGYRGPFGVGWPMANLENKKVLVIAGGCGLAPLASFINHRILHRRNKDTVVIYGTRNRAIQILEKERQFWNTQIDLIETFEESFTNDIPSENPIDKIDEAFELLKGKPEAVVMCGPETMMQKTSEHFITLGLEPKNIYLSMERRMHCGVGTCGHCFIGHQYCCTDGPTFSLKTLSSLGFD